jgi:lanosterol synthase
MTERSYIECTSSCIGGLSRLRDTYPDVLPPALRARVDDSVARGARFLVSQQRPDGSYAGFWGVNFTYAAFHVAEGLLAAGLSPGDRTLTRLCAWVESKQRADGSWGEHYTGCHDDRYVEHPEPQPIMTAWAALTLLHLVPSSSKSVSRAIEWLVAHQQADGSWPKKALAGVFFGTAMLDYRLYKDVFPLWALARAAAARAHQVR